MPNNPDEVILNENLIQGPFCGVFKQINIFKSRYTAHYRTFLFHAALKLQCSRQQAIMCYGFTTFARLIHIQRCNFLNL